MCRWLLVLCLLLLPSLTWAAPTVTAGPTPYTLNFPAKEQTLFGQATDSGNLPMTLAWTCQTCPRSVSFSAPWATHTTVIFTAPSAQETYVFRLTATNSASQTAFADATLTLNPSSIYVSGTNAFYVDPTYTGSTETGAAATPWKSLTDTDADFTTKWNTINTALLTNDVIVYFSARQAGSDTAEQFTNKTIYINRKCRVRTVSTLITLSLCPTVDTSTKRLTIDGMSKYNTNDATPSWVDYTGTNRFKLSGGSSSLGFGWSDGDATLPRDYITLRGFEITGNQARTSISGSHLTLEYFYMHDVTALGPGFLFDNNITNYSDCVPIGERHYVTIRNNQSFRTEGESYYLGGSYYQTIQGGCPRPTYTQPAQSDLLVEGNESVGAGTNGGEGDGFDLKSGWVWVTFRSNISRDGVGSLGSFTVLGPWNDQGPSYYLMEMNRLGPGPGYGISAAPWSGIMRNNIIYSHRAGVGVGLDGYCAEGYPSGPAQIYNNTIYNNVQTVSPFSGTGIMLSCNTAGVIYIRNNLIFGNGTSLQITNGGPGQSPALSDYNLLAPAGSAFTEGSNSIIQSSITGIVVDGAGGDFHLTPTSPALNEGISMSVLANLPSQAASLSITYDIVGNTRPQGAAWDIGAYEFNEGGGGDTTPPGAPANLRVVGP